MTGREFILRFLTILAISIFPSSPVFAAGPAEEADFVYIKKVFNDGFYNLSQAKLESFIKNYPQTQHLYQAHTILGRGYYEQNNSSRALYEFQEILGSPAAAEFHDEALYWSGEIYTNNGDLNSALECYERIINDFPASKYLAYAVYSKGWVYYMLGFPEEAIKCFENVVLKYPMDKVSMEAQFRLGECLYLSARYEKAEEELDRFIEKYPVSDKTPEAYYLNGETKYCRGKPKESIAFFDRALSISPGARWAPLAVYGAGRALCELGEFTASSGRFKRCLEMAGGDSVKSRALLGLVINYRRSLVFSEAHKICDQIIAEYPEGDIAQEAYYQKVKLLYDDGRYAEAEGVAMKAMANFAHAPVPPVSGTVRGLTDSPSASLMRYELGRVYTMQDRYDEAVKEFIRVEDEAKDAELRASALVKIGDIYFDEGDYKKATESYDGVLNKYSGSFSADYVQYQIANISSLSARYDQAILAYQVILVNFPDTDLRGKVIFRLGEAYFNLGDYERARAEFERSLSEFPTGRSADRARLYLANSMYNMSMYDSALTAFREIENSLPALYHHGPGPAGRQTPSDAKLKAMAAYQIGWCYHNLRKEPEAAAAFERYLKNYPDSELAPDARFWFGEYYRSKGKLDKAKGYFDSILADFPYCDLIREALTEAAVVLSEEGKPDEAISKLEELAKRFPGSDSGKMAYRKIAKIKKIKKDFDQAIEYYRKALTGDNNELNAEIQYEIAESYEMKGDLQGASDEYLKVTDLYSNGAFWSVRAQLKCAQALEAVGKPCEASLLYEKLAGMEVEESDFAKKRLDILRRTDGR